jgi:hypothetical protein
MHPLLMSLLSMIQPRGGGLGQSMRTPDASGGGNPAYANALNGPPSGSRKKGYFAGLVSPETDSFSASLYSGAPSTSVPGAGTGGGTIGPGGNNVGVGGPGAAQPQGAMNPVLKALLGGFTDELFNRPQMPTAPQFEPTIRRQNAAYSGGRLALPAMTGGGGRMY